MKKWPCKQGPEEDKQPNNKAVHKGMIQNKQNTQHTANTQNNILCNLSHDVFVHTSQLLCTRHNVSPRNFVPFCMQYCPVWNAVVHAFLSIGSLSSGTILLVAHTAHYVDNATEKVEVCQFLQQTIYVTLSSEPYPVMYILLQTKHSGCGYISFQIGRAHV